MLCPWRRLATAQKALDIEHTSLSTQLTAARTQFGDLSSFLRHALAEQTARAEGLENELADARAALAAAEQRAAKAAAAAEARRQAEVGECQAALDAQAAAVREAEGFLAERNGLAAQAAAAHATLEEERRAHRKQQMVGSAWVLRSKAEQRARCSACQAACIGSETAGAVLSCLPTLHTTCDAAARICCECAHDVHGVQDLERKHASDRELWRMDTAEAVHAAREEMAALADTRLDATTKQTIFDNEAMAGELQTAGRRGER